MPSAEKITQVNTFTGGMNRDYADEHIPNDVYRYMLNCRVLATANSEKGVVTNLKGNLQVEFDLPEGENKVIGFEADEERNVFVFALWNSEGYHTWYRYYAPENSVSVIMQCRTDTDDIDIWQWTKEDLILHIDIWQNKLLYWAKKGDPARKINMLKAMDKSEAGYGNPIPEEFTRAYKRTSALAPYAEYFTDISVPYNRLYGFQFKFAVRYRYDDNELSHYSDWSIVANPNNELFNGNVIIPTDNNSIKLTYNTGSAIITHVEIVMTKTLSEATDGINFVSGWYTIAVIDKKEKGLSDNTDAYFYFFNDGAYVAADQSEVMQHYSYLPDRPECQSLIKNAITYSNFYEGFPNVPLDASVEVNYEDLFIDNDEAIVENNPVITINHTSIYQRNKGLFNDWWMITEAKITIGNDVKQGNIFRVWAKNGAAINLSYQYTATKTDTANEVAQFFANTFRQDSNYEWVSSVSAAGGGAYEFDLKYRGQFKKGATFFTGDAVGTKNSVLKPNSKSVRNFKHGSTWKLGIEYEDRDGRKTAVYTNDDLSVKVDPINDYSTIQEITLQLSINHTPPEWARFWQVMLTKDLTHGDDFIQLMIQKVVEFEATEGNSSPESYLDLVVGSLFTYQKIHPNTTLRYEFKKGDRLRLIKEVDVDAGTETMYPFYETEIISYTEVDDERFDEVTKTVENSDVLQVPDPQSDKIGLLVVLPDGHQRKIIAVESNGYKVSAPFPSNWTYDHYRIVNNLGSIRIKKPTGLNPVDIEDFSVVEVYTPALNTSAVGVDNFYSFGLKFPVIDWGTDTRRHAGNVQDQDVGQPAIVKIEGGTSYVRNRELPVTNNFPNAQVHVSMIEDPAYSDFYYSRLYSLGRPSAQDIGTGVVHFDSRVRNSRNAIEDTRINGLSLFANADRKDYNDQYGAIKLTYASENRLYIFKENKTYWGPVYGRVITDQEGQPQLAITNEILSDTLQPFLYDGGVGNNPETVVRDGNHFFFLSPKLGSINRIGGDGVETISERYFMDSWSKEMLALATESSAKIPAGFDRNNGEYIFCINGYAIKVSNKEFDSSDWDTSGPVPASGSTIEILAGPANGSASVVGDMIEYTPDSDYVGPDTISYRVNVDGDWVSGQMCIDVIPDDQIFYNDEMSKDFQKNDCANQSGGSIVTYTVPAGKYSSTISKAEANNMAINDLENNGQDYANQNGTCEWVNRRQSQMFTKNNCGDGGDGTQVEYVVPAGTYQSTLSQEDADQQALNDIAANGQNYANANGSCTWWNDEMNEDFQKDDCPPGQTGSTVTYTVDAHTYSSTISKADANQKAQDDIDINGQAWANNYGTCSFLGNIEWGYFNSQPDTNDPGSIVFQFNKDVPVNSSEYDMDFTPNGNTKWLAFSEPDTEPVKTEWKSSDFNYGDMPDQVWLAPIVESGRRYYISRRTVALGVGFETITVKE